MQLSNLRESEDFIQLPLLIPMSTIVPRGIFYRSYLYKILNGSFQDVDGTPLDGMNVMGNENNGSINSNTIQLILYRNSTWTQAEKILSYLLKNESGNLSYTYLDVTNEFYTIGFNHDVLNLTPNLIVRNSGNGTAPKKPQDDPSFWQFVWNTFCGFVSYTWNSITAAANYMVNLFKAVMEWGIGLVKAIANGSALEYIQDTIVKPFVDALMAFINWVVNWITSCLKAIIDPLVAPIGNAIDQYVTGLGSLLERALVQYKSMGKIKDVTGKGIMNLMLGSFFWILLAVSTAIVVATVLLTYSTVVLGLVMSLLASIIATVVLLALFGESNFDRTKISPGTLSSMSISGIFALARAFMEQNVGSPLDFSAMLDAMALLFSTWGTAIRLHLVVAMADWSGWVAIIFGIAASLLAIAITVWVRNHSPSPEVTEKALDMLAVAGVAWGILTLVVSVVGLKRVDVRLKPLAYTAIVFAGIAIALGIAALTV